MTVEKAERETRLKLVTVSPQLPIAEAIPVLDRGGLGVLLLCDKDRKLSGILTDGDIRRAIIHGVSFEKPSITIANRNPVKASTNVLKSEALHLMDHSREFVVNHLPVVDKDGRVIDLLLRRDLISQEHLPLSAVIMAGGYGTRLRPLTEELPKPMLPLDGKPIMEQIIAKLRHAGIERIYVTTFYKAEKITDYFGDGKDFGVELYYVNEVKPLGTAGALGLIPKPSEPLLVINSDIITKVDFRAMLAYHREHFADMTVAVRQYSVQVPYGAVECEGPRILSLSEKPQASFLVNAGIYLLEPSVYQFIFTGEHFNMTDLIRCLLEARRSVVSFPIIEYWIDVGQHTDYERAKNDVQTGKLKL